MRRWPCSLRACLFVAGLTLAGATRASGGNATRRISLTCCRRGGSGPTAVCLDWSIHCGCRRLSLYFFQLWIGSLSGWEILRCRGILQSMFYFCSWSGQVGRCVGVQLYSLFLMKSRCWRPGCLTGRRRLPNVMLPPRRTSLLACSHARYNQQSTINKVNGTGSPISPSLLKNSSVALAQKKTNRGLPDCRCDKTKTA